MLSIAAIMIACPDCFDGFVMALMAAWLSAYMTHFVKFDGESLAIEAARSNAVTSAVKTL
jgi:hypothetical protein